MNESDKALEHAVNEGSEALRYTAKNEEEQRLKNLTQEYEALKKETATNKLKREERRNSFVAWTFIITDWLITISIWLYFLIGIIVSLDYLCDSRLFNKEKLGQIGDFYLMTGKYTLPVLVAYLIRQSLRGLLDSIIELVGKIFPKR